MKGGQRRKHSRVWRKSHVSCFGNQCPHWGRTQVSGRIVRTVSRCILPDVSGPDKFTAFLLELLGPLGPVSARRMFGGVGLFHGGNMFGLIARDELYLKVGEANLNLGLVHQFPASFRCDAGWSIDARAANA